MLLGKTDFLVLILALVTVFPAYASGSAVSITPAIADMGVCTASFTNQLVRVTNIGTSTDTYKLGSDSNLVTFAGCDQGSVSNNEVVLGSGETAFCSVFINPLNNTPTQKYSVALNANSESSPDSASAKISVNVLACNAVSLTTQGVVSACSRDRFSTSIIIKNVGKSTETFNISSDKAGKFDKNSVTLFKDQSEVIAFESSYGNASANKIRFVAQSKDSAASAEATLEVNVRECFKFDASLTQPAGLICLRKPVVFDLNVKNTGDKPDIFAADAAAELSQKQVALNSSQNATIKMTYYPAKEGRFRLNVSVKSVGSDIAKTLYSEAEAKECGSISLMPLVSEGSVCRGETFTYGVDIKNVGAATELYNLNATKGTLSVNKVIVDPGETETVYLAVNSTNLSENKTNEILFTASAGSLKESAKLSLNVGLCHSAIVKVVPASLTVCAPDTASFKVEINNNGRKPETFTVFAVGSKIAENLLVPENTTKSLGFIANYSNDTGIYRVDAEAVSDALDVKSAGALVVKDYKACYGGALTAKDIKKDVKPSDRALQELQLRNTGIKTLNYILQAVGPSWVSLGISNITLEPNETSKLYLFVSPPFGTKIGNYNTTVIALSEKGVSSKIDFAANIIESVTTTTLKFNATTTSTTSPASGDQRRTVVVGIILAIAAILILRYIFTSK